MAQAPHLVLARKWRPERFADLVGQEHVTHTLAEALKRGRIAHAFLFTGIRGVGKTTAARILARCLNCEHGPTADPCGKCPACVEIRAGRSLDVSEIDGATYRKIDDARAIIENLSYRPARDRFKIYIIDEAHQLTDQAFNALLKTLEEPPPHVKFILATTEPQKMPETILSRLQRYDFRRIPAATIFQRLAGLVAREKIDADEAALHLIAREAGGSMRDAERMLETAIASAAEDRLTEAEVAASLGVASRTIVFEIVAAIIAHQGAAALRTMRELAARGANLESLGRDLLETLRNLAVAKLPRDPDQQDAQDPLAELPDAEAAALRRLAEQPSNRDLMRLFRLMAQAQEELLRSPYPDLLLEMAIVRMASLAPVIDLDELLHQIAAGSGNPPPSSESGPGGSGPHSRPAVPSGASPNAGARKLRVEGEVKASAPVRSAFSSAAQPGAKQVGAAGKESAREMPDLRDHIRSRRAALAGFMEQGAGLALDGDVLKITPQSDIYVRYFADNRAVIAELASEFFGHPIRTEIARRDAAAPAAAHADSTAQNGTPTPSQPNAPLSDDRRAPAGPAMRPVALSDQERTALFADPVVDRVFETFAARLVEMRAPAEPPPAVPRETGCEEQGEDPDPSDA